MRSKKAYNIQAVGLLHLLCLAALYSVSLSCSGTTSAGEDEVGKMIDEVRAMTSSYKNVESATSGGWNQIMSPCVAHPEEGGMGYHYGRPAFIDGRINHLEPQILLFEPLQNGDLELIGVEYIIPFAILSDDSDPPELFGEHYHQNYDLDIWALHLWTEKENPKGQFYDWNPNVSCQYAND